MLNGQNAHVVELIAMRAAWRDLAVRWELTWHERQALLPEGGEDAARPPADTEKRMRILLEIGYRLCFESEVEMCDWLRTPAKLWRWNTPIEVMSGSVPDLRHFRVYVEQGLGR